MNDEDVITKLLELDPATDESGLSPDILAMVQANEEAVAENPDGVDSAENPHSGAAPGERPPESLEPEELPPMGSVSGLSPQHVKEAVNAALQAAVLGLRHERAIHYTMGGARWSGINGNRIAAKGQYPSYADCSAYVTWCYWNGLTQRGTHHSDIVNGANWQAGYTGTMLNHGRAVSSPIPGDAIIYGPGWPGEHTALYTGGGLVVSHGSEPGPMLLRWRYRSDVLSIRRYI
jgi:hypothetical protein